MRSVVATALLFALISAVLAPFLPRVASVFRRQAMTRGAVLCISHGGGPMPVLGDKAHGEIVRSLKTKAPKILRLGTPEAPRAIVVVTAHWSAAQPSISSASSHRLLYDYGGFPPEAYKLKYRAPGAPDVAKEVKRAMEEVGLKPTLDPERGWDHGVFIPFLLIHPAADIPIVQVSVLASEDPESHIRIGRALAKLRDSNVAIVGSGFASFHNLRLMSDLKFASPSTAATVLEKSRVWNDAVTDAVLEPSLDDRAQKLEHWRDFPHSYDVHPRGGGDHFMPLIVCAGAAGDEKGATYKDDYLGLDIWSYYWE